MGRASPIWSLGFATRRLSGAVRGGLREEEVERRGGTSFADLVTGLRDERLSGAVGLSAFSHWASLGAYDEEESAARAYDLAAIKYWGTSTFTNFPISDYEKEIEIMQTVTKKEYLATLRRHHNNGRWEARIGRVFGNKYLYLGTYSTQEEAARAYDIAAIEYRGINAVTKFDLSTYIGWLKPGANTSLATHEPQAILEPQTLMSPTNYTSKEEPQSLFFHSNSSATDYLKSPQKNSDIFESKIPINSCNKSSPPTALGLLLRSSVFKELVEKNSNIPEDYTDGEEPNNQAVIGSDDDFCGIFYDGIGDIPFVCTSNEDSIELQERGLDFIL
ncbi:ethylene-responsive transcription factor WRI1-like isoform X1 [Fagus crenata]